MLDRSVPIISLKLSHNGHVQYLFCIHLGTAGAAVMGSDAAKVRVNTDQPPVVVHLIVVVESWASFVEVQSMPVATKLLSKRDL